MLILYENCSITFFVNNRVQLRTTFQNNFRTLLDTRSPQVTTIIWLTVEFYWYVLINIFLGAMSRRRCGVCDNCKQADCGLCMYCRDKPRFGGPGKLKQSCLKRKCTRLGSSSKQLTGKQWVALCYNAISQQRNFCNFTSIFKWEQRCTFYCMPHTICPAVPTEASSVPAMTTYRLHPTTITEAPDSPSYTGLTGVSKNVSIYHNAVGYCKQQNTFVYLSP